MAYGYGSTKKQTPEERAEAELKTYLNAPGADGYGGAWLLCGPETYLSSYYRDKIRKKIIPDPEMGYFDHIRLSGAKCKEMESGALHADMTLGMRLAAACEGVPVMGEHKLIEIAEPCFPDMRAAELEDFCDAISGAAQYPYVTVVILCAEEEFPTDYRSKIGTVWKALEKTELHIVPFPYQEQGKLRGWCARHFASEGIEAAPYLIDQMIVRVGRSMTALAGEMQKLCCYLHANKRNSLSEQDIPFICAATENAAAFGIQNAVRDRDIRALSEQYRILKREKEEPITLFFGISSAIGDLWKIKTGLAEGYTREELSKLYKIKDYPMRLLVQGCGNYSLSTLQRLQRQCAETDVQLKSSPVDGYVLVERLICAMTKRYEAEADGGLS